MLAFLKHSRRLLNQSEKVCIVLGNESCDLDSAVSAIALAFFYSKIYPERTGFMPVINIPRSNFPIKTEVSYYLRKHNITDDDLVFKDDTSNDFMTKNSVILVDHHVSPFRDSVIEVFDHRPYDQCCGLPKSCKKTIEEVGSCATLIGNLILKSKNYDNEFKQVFQLLYGAIVMDTVNFSPEACRKTELDTEIASQIEDILGVLDRSHHRKVLFSELVKAREDVSSLTAFQLLNKDMKLIANPSGSIKVGIPGYPISVQEFIQKPNAEMHVKMFAEQNDCSVILLIGMKIINGVDVRRDIGLINIKDASLFDKILEQMKLHDNPNLKLREIDSVFMGGRFFQQENIRPTRKQILPIIKTILDGK